ncbi:hypothetical protein ACWC5I_02025 [Kitasatospora sp. NPDC001574]
MDVIVTGVNLHKANAPVLEAEERIANLVERGFELGRQLDAARIEIARRDATDSIWVEVVMGLLSRVEALEVESDLAWALLSGTRH